MRLLNAVPLFILLITLQCSRAVSPTGCDDAEPVARKALDLINKGRWDGYLFELLQVADAHLDKSESTAVYYLVLHVKESDCPVLSRKHWDDCEPAVSTRPSDIVIGQCKVIATTCLDGSQDLRVNGFNCTTSSASSVLANTKDSPVLIDFFEDTEPYRKEANQTLEKYKRENSDFASFRVDKVERVARVRGGERTNYYVDFSVRNCSSRWRSPTFGFCRADFINDAEASDLENPEDIVINCEVFNFKDHRNISGGQKHLGHRFHSGEHEHSPAGRPPHKPGRSRDHHDSHKPHKFGCPPPLGDKSHSDSPPFQAEASPSLASLGTNGVHGPSDNHSSSEHHLPGHPPHGRHPHGPPPHGRHPHGPPPHGRHPHGPPPHGHHPHGPPPHGHHPHGPPPHGHHPHGPPPHGRHPHGPPPHGHHPHGPPPHRHHPHGHDFHDYGPCDPPPHSQDPQDHHRWGHGPPPRHSEERGPGKKHFPFHGREIGYVHRLPPLKKGEVLPLPEANFPSFLLLHHKPLQPEIQPFPQSASESCPGTFRGEFSHLSKFFAHTFPK
ncbi:histidine-rich glycoprotein precursor [Sus scrofa]|uniref:histidine-rich glycoprotein precursor n=1 Tax=Sus scrofa TaxID=9823 RepID=UPI00022925B8|nr:histidine-rich glycoprotein precursor [Sus scrofa]